MSWPVRVNRQLGLSWFGHRGSTGPIVRKLAAVLGGLLLAGAPFGAHALAAQTADQTCTTVPVTGERVCFPPTGVPSVPQLPPPPSVPVPPAPSLPGLPSLPQVPVPSLPQLPTLPNAPLPQTPSLPLPAIPPLPSLPLPQPPLVGPAPTATTTSAAHAAGAVCNSSPTRVINHLLSGIGIGGCLGR